MKSPSHLKNYYNDLTEFSRSTIPRLQNYGELVEYLDGFPNSIYYVAKALYRPDTKAFLGKEVIDALNEIFGFHLKIEQIFLGDENVGNGTQFRLWAENDNLVMLHKAGPTNIASTKILFDLRNGRPYNMVATTFLSCSLENFASHSYSPDFGRQNQKIIDIYPAHNANSEAAQMGYVHVLQNQVGIFLEAYAADIEEMISF